MMGSLLSSMTKGDTCLLQLQPEEGADCWFYVRIHPGKRIKLEMAIKQGHVDCSELGDVLASGYGRKPPPHIQWMMAQKH